MRQTLGVDLGTTNTAAALGGRVLALGATRALLPSVVAFLPNGTVQVGAAARRRRASDRQNTIFSSKRVIGRRWEEPEVQEFRERYPFDLEEKDGGPGFVTRAGTFSPTDIAAIVLATIHDKVERVASDLEIVITVPAGYSERQRFATLEAAGKAKFPAAQLIDEPASAARAYRRILGPLKRVAVYDLGGGTFDFAIVDCSESEPQVLRTASDMFLGGDDIDAKIAEWVAAEVLKNHNWDLTNYPEVHNRLLAECEGAKIRLSKWERTSLDLSKVDPEFPAAAEPMRLRREVIDELAERLVRRTFNTCDRVLREVGVAPDDLDAVLLAGGSTHLPMVKAGVEAYFGRAGRDDLEATEVVARGASPGD